MICFIGTVKLHCGKREECAMKLKKAGLLTKGVILALLIYMSITLLNLQTRIQETQAVRDSYQQQVDDQTQINTALAGDVANSDDPEHVLRIARSKLGLVAPGEIIFEDITN